MVTTKVELNPFPVPDSVTQKGSVGKREDGVRWSPLFRLGDLSDETLKALIAEFSSSIFRKAEQQRHLATRSL